MSTNINTRRVIPVPMTMTMTMITMIMPRSAMAIITGMGIITAL